MSQREPTRIPWASLAVVATFVSGTLIVPKAFDLLRPPEKERAQQFSGADLEVDARLWEDPFAAVRRHENDRVERCKNPAAASKRECDADQRDARRSPQALREHLDADDDGEIDAQSTLLIAVLVPGNPFVGAEEARRRTRFALLSGLQAEGYFPDSAEQIGLMQVPLAPIATLAPLTRLASHLPPPTAAASAPATGGDLLQIPYELLSRSRSVRPAEETSAAAASTAAASAASASAAASPASAASAPDATRQRRSYRSVVVVWVDEAALPGPKLDGVARLLDTVIACRRQACPRLAVIGPSSSDGLDLLLHGLEAALARRAQAPENIDASLANGYRLLAQARFYSPAATISDEDLPLLRRYGHTVPEFFTSYFTGIVPERARLSEAEREVPFTRTIGADITVATLLASEVLQRLPAESKRRVVTIVESDSIYARGLDRRMRHLLANGPQISRVDQAYFFRGIDGVTVRDGTTERTPPAAKPKDEAAAVEWPEARDQLDYLRRMAEELKASESAEGGGPIGAIGIFANDVHDKLLVLQALHDTFPDKVFFTTDMDARFVHPRVLPFTRNLVVASSLPLKMPPVLEAAADGSLVRGRRQVHEGAPPLRDVYQTAAYLAARMAACTRACEIVQRATQAAIQSPSVYEIGRNGAVAIGGFDASAQRQQRPGSGTSILLAAGLAVLTLGLLLWPSTPVLRAAHARWQQGSIAPGGSGGTSGTGGPGVPAGPPMHLAPWLGVGYGLWLGFAAASVLETAAPASLGLAGTLAWSALGGAAVGLLSPGLRMFAPSGHDAGGAAGRGHASPVFSLLSPLSLLSLLILVALLGGAWWLAGPGLPGYGEPLRWLDGISGWPSHFLNLIAFLVVLVSLDLYADGARALTRAQDEWLGWRPLAPAPLSPSVPGEAPGPTRRAGAWLQRHSLLAWRLPAAGRVEFAVVWQRFRQLSEPTPRLVRVLFWYALTVVGATVLFVVLTGTTLPDVPVRGTEHRAIVLAGLVAALAALPALVLAVADATLATCRLLWALGRGRASYPPEVVARFARDLGPEIEEKIAQAMAADPGDRGDRAGESEGMEGLQGTQRSGGAGGTEGLERTQPASPRVHTLLDDWISIEFVARQTQAVSPLIVAPFVVLGLLVMARSRLFDSWAVTWPIVLTAAIYLMGLLVLAVALKLSAENLRDAALARMRADLLWLGGAGGGREKLAEPLKQLIAAVEGNTTGAFAPLLEQPLVAALMVPLGSAGGVQLFDRLLLAR
ncbi:MAG: hypothetical protein HZC37_00615 [Burkholderiales bacterium]|nr:hypothetical protein [Burkholderiales bacterium]